MFSARLKTTGILAKRPVHLLTGIIAVIVLGYCAILATVLSASRQAVGERAGDAGASLVAAIESHVARNIRVVDASLQGVLDNLKYPGVDKLEGELRQLVLFDRSAMAEDLGTIMVLDQDGNLRFDSRTIHVKKQNLADREYFKVHKENAAVGLFIGKPIVARVTGQWFVGLSRRISREDGSFAGVVVASLRLSYFEKLFERAWLKNNSNITLASLDGTVLMRWPYNPAYIGLELGHADIYKHLAEARSGRFETVSVTDGEKRLVAYSQIADFPLVIGVGQSTTFVYQNWFKHALFVVVTMLVLSGLTLFLALFLGRELQRRMEAEAELATLAMTDGLTGLFNHRHFNETLEREWRRAARDQKTLSLMMIDTDSFKIYNDSHGHQYGDTLLKAIAAAIAASINRGSDYAARYGGDEFIVLLPGTPADGAANVGEKIRSRLTSICGENGIQTVSLSIGIASKVPDLDKPFADLLKSADEAMYRAKDLGRNRTEFAVRSPGKTPRDIAA